MKALHITGNTLTLEDVREVVYDNRPVLLDPDARTGGGPRTRGDRRRGRHTIGSPMR